MPATTNDNVGDWTTVYTIQASSEVSKTGALHHQTDWQDPSPA